MQLGTRWSVGAEPPSRLPIEIIHRIREVEGHLNADQIATLRWTLTWLEGRPIVELDDGTVISTAE